MKSKISWPIAVGLMLALAAPIHAASESATHGVSIEVPPSLAIETSQSEIRLAFEENAAGAQTNETTVHYQVRSNGMSQADGATAVTAQLDDSLEGMEFQAMAGSFSRTGGNTELTPINAGYANISASTTPLMAKNNSTGDGRLLAGSFPVTYKAVALQAMASGTHTRQLVLTLTDT